MSEVEMEDVSDTRDLEKRIKEAVTRARKKIGTCKYYQSSPSLEMVFNPYHYEYEGRCINIILLRGLFYGDESFFLGKRPEAVCKVCEYYEENSA